MTQSEELKIAIMVTTFRRPASLACTLESLVQQTMGHSAFTICVIDNDADPAVNALVSAFQKRTGLTIEYHAEPRRGVAQARNRALDLVSDDLDYVAFIDDDEVASPTWLLSLLKTAKHFGADIVQGPVEPLYERSVPSWFRDGRMTALGPFREGEALRFGFSGNVLLSASMLRSTQLRFELCFDQTGGEDQHFFMGLMQRGYRIVTSRDAIVFETIPASRTAFGDFMRRRFRIGATLTMAWRLLRQDRLVIPKRIVIGAGHACLGALQCLPPWHWSSVRLAENMGRMAYGWGQIMGAAGWSVASYETIHKTQADQDNRM